MKKFDFERYITYIFIFFISIMMFMTSVNIIKGCYYKFIAGKENSSSNLYALKAMVQNFKGDIEASVVFRTKFIEFNGLFRKLIGQTYIDDVETQNAVVKLNNGHLSFLIPEYDTSKVADNLINMVEKLEEKNVDLLYIQVPSKIDENNKKLPKGIEDFSNENADKFLEKIDGKVDYIDIRDEVKKDNIDLYDQFFYTDHHWKPEFAFYTFNKVAKVLNNNYGFNISEDITNQLNYDKKIYSNYFLGSLGKRVGKYYAGLDDISLITPKFETDLRYEIPSHNVDKQGSFSETILDYGHIEVKDYYNKNPYAVYTGGDFAFSRITNNLIKDKKVLLIRDSFGCAFAPFLSLGVSQLDIVDLRINKDIVISEYVLENDIDIVLILYYASEFTNTKEAAFSFN